MGAYQLGYLMGEAGLSWVLAILWIGLASRFSRTLKEHVGFTHVIGMALALIPAIIPFDNDPLAYAGSLIAILAILWRYNQQLIRREVLNRAQRS